MSTMQSVRIIKNCRSCGSEDLEGIFDLGEQYVSDFRQDDSKPNKYPIEAVICKECLLVQLKHTTPSQDMYHDNYGFKSGVSNSIKDDLKDIVHETLGMYPQPSSWLDIASNDGTLLNYVPRRVYQVGVDPIEKYCHEAEENLPHAVIINDFYDAQLVRDIGPFDVITSISCFYDMDDPNTFVRDVKAMLNHGGIWVIQQNYLATTIELGAVDNFCHEHLEYYTLHSLEGLLNRHGLKVVKVSTSMVNGGSIRTFVMRDGFDEDESVDKQRNFERKSGLLEIGTYKEFGEKAMKNLSDLRKLVDKLNSQNKSICILAASTRGATIWQSANIGINDVDYAVERNPEKVGRNFSAIGIPIVSEEQFRKDKPDYAIVGPWFFSDEIIAREGEYLKNGGKLILPLPTVRVVGE